jgi:simple sugar transport system permease protein
LDVAIALIMWTVFVVAAPDVFLRGRIYASFALTTPLFAIIALSLTFVIIAREMDLSFAGVQVLAMVGFVNAFQFTNSVTLAVIACLLVGLLCGLFNGYLVAVLGIPSLVITLGTMFFFRGTAMALLDGRGVSLTGQEFVPLRNVLNGQILGIPNEMVWMVVVAILLWVVLNRTRFGAHVFVVGDNATSAELMGINVRRVKMTAFALVGVASAFTAIIASLQVSYLWPTLGGGAEGLLRPIAAVFLGGTSVFGGIGTIAGTFLGSLMVGSINAGVISAGISGFYVQLFFGLVIIISLIVQTAIRNRMKR